MSQYVLVDVKHDTFLPFIQSQGEKYTSSQYCYQYRFDMFAISESKSPLERNY